jgi:hypothetical protein
MCAVDDDFDVFQAISLEAVVFLFGDALGWSGFGYDWNGFDGCTGDNWNNIIQFADKNLKRVEGSTNKLISSIQLDIDCPSVSVSTLAHTFLYLSM